MNAPHESVGFDCGAFVKETRAGGVIMVALDGDIRLWGPQERVRNPELLDRIRANKATLLEHLSDPSIETGCRVKLDIDSGTEFDPFPLTEIQRAYWIGRQQAFSHGEVSIHYYTEIDCRDVDCVRLERAWNRTVQFHGMLRAVVDEAGIQRILPEVPHYRIPCTDLRALGEAERRRALDRHRHEMSHEVRSTDIWPGFELHLFRIGDRDYRLTYSQDLLHVDGGSLLVVIDDFCGWYFEPDRDVPAPGLNFRDYVQHEIALKRTAGYEADLKYWKQAVRDLPPPPALPMRTAGTSARHFSRWAFTLDFAAFESIKRQAASMQITPTAYVLAAFSEVISRWNGANDFTMNVTVFNRPNIHRDIHRIVGDFTSMVPVAIRAEHGDTMAVRTAVLQRSLWHHIGHRNVSGVTVLDLLRRAKGNRQAADLSVVFTSLLSLSNQGFPNTQFSRLGRCVYTVTQTPQVILDHQVAETADGGIVFTWDVVEGRFPEGLIDDMFSAYRDLVKRLLESDATWREQAPAQLPGNQRRVIAAMNDTAAQWPRDRTLRDLFAEQADRQPDTRCLVTGERELRYGTLRALAHQHALRLTAVGVKPGDRVGIVMNKGWTQPVAALAAHVAGAAYVPIDPATPKARYLHILAESELSAVLTDAVHAGWHAPTNDNRVVVDDTPPDVTAIRTVDPAPLRPSDVSHVIYTSGSTGRPKGVVIEHRNVTNRVHDINTRFNIGPGDAILGLTALHHDLSVYDIFGVLAAGATLVLPSDDERLDPSHWCSLMARHRVTLWNSVPAFAGMLADYLECEPDAASEIPLRWMILAGDWIPVELPRRIHRFWPTLDFIASGGPTETTIWDIWNRVERVDPDWPSIPYGRPLANSRYHVLDQRRNRCPLWVPGELHVSGEGVTRGYLNQVDATAEKYLQLPGIEGRVLRSGDLGRLLPDGSIEFLGRADFQVQLNGTRIELGEIETTALGVPGVRDCAAVVRTTPQGPALALFVASGDARTSVGDTAAQRAALETRGVSVTDPVTRLAQKLAYASLTPDRNAVFLRLPEPAAPVPDLKSHRAFSPGPVTIEQLAEFFAPLRGVRDASDEARFQYGSAGGLYPVQIYAYLKPGYVQGFPAGIYRYFPLEHALERVREITLGDDVHWPYNRTMGRASGFYVFLIGDLSVIRAQYGDLAEPMAYIEAGMVAQRLRHAARESGFGTCPVGDIGFPRYADSFGLGADQVFLCALIAGRIAAEATETDRTLTEQVRHHLRAQLPHHMVPAHIVRMDALPLTRNGKVDRKSLSMVATVPNAGVGHQEPQDGIETLVAGVLGRLLDAGRVSSTANFFDLGANSALLVKAHREISKRSGRSFPLINLFRFPTVRSLAAAISQDGPHKDDGASRARVERQKEAIENFRKIRSGATN